MVLGLQAASEQLRTSLFATITFPKSWILPSGLCCRKDEAFLNLSSHKLKVQVDMALHRTQNGSHTQALLGMLTLLHQVFSSGELTVNYR